MDQATSPRPLALARWLFVVAAMIVAIVAIGGIDLGNAAAVIAAGADGVAVVSSSAIAQR